MSSSEPMTADPTRAAVDDGLTDLERLQRAATPGTWTVFRADNRWGIRTDGGLIVALHLSRQDAAYIVAAREAVQDDD